MNDTPQPSEKSRTNRVTRRTFVSSAGLAIGSLGLLSGFSGAGAAQEQEPETITVPSGQVHTINLGDGESLENVVIDITSDNSGYEIRAEGSDWTIRNVGVRGQYDNGGDTPFHVRDTDPNGESVIENVYLGDGAADAFQWNTHQVTGIYVHADHAGDLLVKNVYINEFRDNAIYASDPGHPEWEYAANGTVRIEDAFARNGGFNFRISSEGSYCDNCVSVITEPYNTGGPRLFTDYFSRGLEFRNCDAVGGGEYIGWSNGTTAWPEYTENGDVYLENCRADVGQLVGGEHPDQWTGEEPGSDPDPEPPSGVPQSPEEAAGGAAGDE